MASLGCASVSHKLVAQIHRYNLIRRPYNKFLAPATFSISFSVSCWLVLDVFV